MKKKCNNHKDIAMLKKRNAELTKCIRDSIPPLMELRDAAAAEMRVIAKHSAANDLELEMAFSGIPKGFGAAADRAIIALLKGINER